MAIAEGLNEKLETGLLKIVNDYAGFCSLRRDGGIPQKDVLQRFANLTVWPGLFRLMVSSELGLEAAAVVAEAERTSHRPPERFAEAVRSVW
jgi:hypothetical protein